MGPSWPGLSRPSTSSLMLELKTWMPGTRPGMTNLAINQHSPDERSDIRGRSHIRSRISLRSSGLRAFHAILRRPPQIAQREFPF
jgi:hypothetical protein